MSGELLKLSRALSFAAEAHANQRRKGAAQEPYINHLIEVMDLVARHTGAQDVELMTAALLHDVVEDTPLTTEALADAFGARVARIVTENSDDMSLPKDERRARRIAGMPHKSPEARIVKTADVISNVRAMVVSAPAGWTTERKLGYLDGCRQLIEAGRGANEALESAFFETAGAAENAVRGAAPMRIEGRAATVRELENAIGQPVHLVYLPNTECRALGRDDVERLAALVGAQFPSGTIQRGEAIYDGVLRDILTVRLRTEGSSEVVAFAQALCLEFEQRFVGIEVGGRYIRVYADDTG